MSPLVLKEWSDVEVPLTLEELTSLRNVAGDALSFAPAAVAGSWILRTNSWVGTISTRTHKILIRPKVNGANLFAMLEADGDPLDLRDAVFEYERSSDLAPAFATLFARALESALRGGMQREYVETEGVLMASKGRVDVRRQARLGGLPTPLACVFDEYVVDSQLNRIIAAAADRLSLMSGVVVETRRSLRRSLHVLEGVGALRNSDLAVRTHFTRLTERFRTVERLARLALESSSVTDAGGRAAASCFLVDMNVVFERFVEHRLRRALAQQFDVLGQLPSRLDVHGKVPIKPDLVFRKGARVVFVADAKYKLAADGTGRQADYYQLLAYCTALGVAHGALLYAQADGAAPENAVLVLGQQGIVLKTLSVTLTGTPSDLDCEIRRVAAKITEWSHESSMEAIYV